MGILGAHSQARNIQAQGIYLINAGGSDVELGGAVHHSVTRQFVPVGRLGVGGDYRPTFAPRFAFGATLYYYYSPNFIKGNWTRDFPGTTVVATAGSYQAGLNNLVLALQATYLF